MWTIWYVNETLTGSSFDDWTSAPSSGVLAVHRLIEQRETYSIGHICLGSDWYWMFPDGSIGESMTTSDDVGAWVDVVVPDGAVAKMGSWASNERMAEIYEELKQKIEN